ncbi:hypothetical protein BFJ71_g15516 [Fusarium oxysporum]|nr:hypothetical protein BFJ71_g15516 [Fusarium oxysporum]
MEHNPNPDFQDRLENLNRPTHKLKDVKIGDSGVQLLLSTKDHLYDAQTVQAGNDSWQIIGAWGESSVKDLAQMLSTRAPTANRQNTAPANFKYGTGQKLGVVDDIRR